MDGPNTASVVLKELRERYYRWGREPTAGDVLALTEGFSEDRVLLVTGLLEEEYPELGEECKREYVRLFYPLHRAAMDGDLEGIERLSIKMADIDARSRFYRLTALIWAVRHDHYEVVRWLLSRGANPNVGSPACGPLHCVQSVEVAELLLDHGAEINEDRLDRTPLDAAIHMWNRHQKPDLVRFFILRGADGKIMRGKNGFIRRDFLSGLPEDDEIRRILEDGWKD